MSQDKNGATPAGSAEPEESQNFPPSLKLHFTSPMNQLVRGRQWGKVNGNGTTHSIEKGKPHSPN